MRWYNGEIIDAVNTSRSKQLLFAVVVVHSTNEKNEESEKMLELWKNANDALYDETMIAICLQEGTEPFQQFAQIYPVPVVPASYLIDLRGKPFDIIVDSVDAVSFTVRLQSAVNSVCSERLRKQSAQSPTLSSPTDGSVSSSGLQEPTTKEASEIIEDNVSNPNESSISNTVEKDHSDHESNKADNSFPAMPKEQSDLRAEDVSGEVVNAENCTDTLRDSNTRTSLNEHVEIARDLLQQKRESDEKLRLQKEKEKELERRRLGNEQSNSKDTQREQEMNQFAEQRKKEQKANQEYIKKLRDKIKADREETQYRLTMTKVSSMPEREEVDRNETLIVNNFAGSQSTLPLNAICKIQCKYADGSTLVHQFSSSAPFSELIEIIRKDSRTSSDFYLVQMHPRREFRDFDTTFLELDLVPSATLMIIQKTSRSLMSIADSFLSRMMNHIVFAPLEAVYRFFMYFIPSKKSVKDRKTESSTKTGNINRFRNEQDSHRDSDDEATWNGNSTQQM